MQKLCTHCKRLFDARGLESHIAFKHGEAGPNSDHAILNTIGPQLKAYLYFNPDPHWQLLNAMDGIGPKLLNP